MKYQSSEVMWQYDKLQFARLISEANAAGLFDSDGVQLMADSMSLSVDAIKELVGRADRFWEGCKASRVLAAPLTEDEARAACDEDGCIEGVVSVDLSVFTDNDLEGVLDTLGEALVDGGSCLSDITYTVVGQQENTLYVLVSGDASFIID